MTDREGPALDEATRALVERAARGGAPASVETRARVLARVEAILGSDGSSGGSPGRSSPPSVAPGQWTRRALPLGASFLLGALAGAIAMRILSTPATSPRGPINVDRAPASPTSTPAGAHEATAAPTAGPTTSTTSGKPAARSPQAEVRPDLTAERQLLDKARQALDREDGAATLAAVAEHERRYPAGVLVQEREAMAVRALLLVGRTGEAQARATRFRTRFPNSVLLPAIESVIDATSTP